MQIERKSFYLSKLVFLLFLFFQFFQFYYFQYEWLKIVRLMILLYYLFMISWIDKISQQIPNKLLKRLFLLRTVILLLECGIYRAYMGSFLFVFIAGFLLGGVLLLLCYLISRGGIGAGDVKLFAVIGYYLGVQKLLEVIFASFSFCAIYSVFFMCRKKIKWKTKISFAPFIFLGSIIVLGIKN